MAQLVEGLPEGSERSSSAATLALVRRLLRADVCEPVPERLLPPSADETVTVVVPFFDHDDRALLATLLSVVETPGIAEVVVVDDASPDASLALVAAESVEVEGAPPILVLRLDRNGGPAAARNAGAARATGKWIAFVDSGVEVGAGWLATLLSVAELDGSALVAPRVQGPEVGSLGSGSGIGTGPGASSGTGRDSGSARRAARLLDLYERLRSPLDLGARSSPVRVGAAVSFVPSACVLVGREPFEALGGFDETLRYGEDVDLVWRMDEAKWSVRYVPEAAATHPARSSVRSWLLQRFHYGRSLGPLADQHPERVHPWAGSISSVLLAGALSAAPTARRTSAVLGLGGLATLGISTARFARALGDATHRDGPQVRPAAELILGSQLAAARGLIRASRRPYLPVLIAGALLPGRLGGSRIVRSVARAWIAAGVALTGTELAREVQADRPGAASLSGRVSQLAGIAAATAVCVADDLAYSAGVWSAAVDGSRWQVVAPRITEFQRGRFG